MTGIRRGDPGDLEEIAAIQDASPEAPRWKVSEYLQYDLRIAVCGDRIAGFLVSHRLADGESEVLNLAVAPGFRRHGIARDLVATLMAENCGEIYLEVRESNQAARNLYNSMGFEEVGKRQKYYENPLEAAIVMKFHSC